MARKAIIEARIGSRDGTHTETAESHHEEKLQATSHACNPGHTHEEEDTKYVLNAWQEDAQECSQFLFLQGMAGKKTPWSNSSVY